MAVQRIIIETSPTEEGRFRAHGHLSGRARNPKWLQGLAEADVSAIGAYLRLSYLIREARQGDRFEFIHAAL